MKVVAKALARDGGPGQSRSRKEPLPFPRPSRVRVLDCKRVGERNARVALGTVTPVPFCQARQVRVELWLEGLRQRDHNRHVDFALCADMSFDPAKLPAEHASVQEQQRTRGLALSRGTHLSLNGEMAEESHHFVDSHFLWRSTVVKLDEAAHPADVRLFGTRAVVTPAQQRAHAVR